MLTGHDAGRDAVAFVGDRILTLNRMPVSVRGVQAGSVTTMRDLTELRQLHQELGITRQTTEALRAQAHEFANRLHTISGLLELGEHEKVLHYVQAARLGDPGADHDRDEPGRRTRRWPPCSSPSPAWPPSGGCACG